LLLSLPRLPLTKKEKRKCLEKALDEIEKEIEEIQKLFKL
jgi:hypothetical protein